MASLVLNIYFTAIGQDKVKAGYIGVNIGTSYLLNGTSDAGKIGANLNVLNFGYSFKRGFGIAFKWMGAAHIISDDNQIGYGAILVGPMYTFQLADNFLLDLKLQPGLFWVREEFKFISNDPGVVNVGKSQTLSVTGFSTGLSFRHNFAKRWSWMLITEFNSGWAPGFFVKGDRINTVSSNLGMGFRI